MFKNDEGTLETDLCAPDGFTHQHYGLAIADLIRHVAALYEVDPVDVLIWVHKELDSPTVDLKHFKLN